MVGMLYDMLAVNFYFLKDVEVKTIKTGLLGEV